MLSLNEEALQKYTANIHSLEARHQKVLLFTCSSLLWKLARSPVSTQNMCCLSFNNDSKGATFICLKGVRGENNNKKNPAFCSTTKINIKEVKPSLPT